MPFFYFTGVFLVIIGVTVLTNPDFDNFGGIDKYLCPLTLNFTQSPLVIVKKSILIFFHSLVDSTAFTIF